MTTESLVYWCNRSFPMKHVADLPRDFRFGSDGDTTLTVDYAQETEVASLLVNFLHDASQRGDNVGQDETDGPHFTYVTEVAEIFTARNKSSEIVAFLIIGPSILSRTFDTCLADINVIRSPDISDQVWADLVRLSVKLTSELDGGYTDCVVSVAAPCRSLVESLLRHADPDTGHQFQTVATLPESVALSSHDVKFNDALLLTCNLGITDRPRRSEPEVLDVVVKYNMADGPEDDVIYEQSTLPSFPFLPQLYRFDSLQGELLVNIRNMRKDEDKMAYNLLVSSARRGEGIDVYDLPTLSSFRQYMLYEGPCMILEDVRNARNIIGFQMLYPSWFARSPSAGYGEVTTVLAKEYQNRRLGSQTVAILCSVAKQLGYTRVVFDYFSSNIRSRQLTSGNVIAGTVPRAGYLVGAGWQDLVINYRDVSTSTTPTFTQLVEMNQRRDNSKL